MTQKGQEPLQPTLGVLTALPKECAAVRVMLENERPAHCDGFYLGEVSSEAGIHRVAVGLLLDMGNNSAAIAATRMLREFPTVQDIIMCGIAGGVPKPGDVERDIRLGDIVVSDRHGVVQYDLIKERADGSKEHRHPPRPPSPLLLQAVRHLRTEEELGRRPWEKLLPRGAKVADGLRPADNLDARGRPVKHPADPPRRAGLPRVFHGTVAAANTLLKNRRHRDYLGRTFGVKCVEMEGSGVADATWSEGAGYLVVRGICDYCDKHKGDHWHGAASIAAAAYVRALIASMRPTEARAVRPAPAAGTAPTTTATSTIGNITAAAGSTVQVTVNTTAAPDTSNRDDRRSEEPRNSSTNTKVPSPRLPMKHTILFLAANPFGTDPRALDREARDIQAELERSGHRDRFEFETRWAVEPLDLLRELRKLKPTVVHFSGHGGPDAADEHLPGPSPRRDVTGGLDHPSSEPQHGLYFQGPDGRPQLVSTEALEATFAAAGASVKLVVLNACYSDVQAKALASHVDCVVGMNGSVRDDAARSFAIGFYGGLGERESVDAAYKQGCAAISLQGIRDHDRPQLTVRPGVDATKLILAEGPADHAAPEAPKASLIATETSSQPSRTGASTATPPKVVTNSQTAEATPMKTGGARRREEKDLWHVRELATRIQHAVQRYGRDLDTLVKRAEQLHRSTGLKNCPFDDEPSVPISSETAHPWISLNRWAENGPRSRAQALSSF